MTVFDDIIKKTLACLPENSRREFSGGGDPRVESGYKNELILKRDAAFELGEGSLPSVSFTAFTNDENLVTGDRIMLYGEDLTGLKQNTPFARISLILTDNIENDGEQGAYSIIKNIDMKKFDVSPRGYMQRASALTNREQVRVSRAALKSGLSFEQVGAQFIEKYRENSHVRAVTVIFVTLPDGPYEELYHLAEGCVTITRALNHVLSDLKMDCRSCGWKPVCDEVEGMKEMHFKAAEHK